MNVLGLVVTEASASVVRAPENAWMDATGEEEITDDDERE